MIHYMFCDIIFTQPFVNIFQDIKFQHLEEEFHQNIHKATMDLRLTDQDIKQFFFRHTPQIYLWKLDVPFWQLL